MNQLSSQQIQISVAPTKNVKIGDLIYLYHENPKTNQGSSKLFKNKDKNLAGKWLVTGINHSFLKESLQVTELILSRDSLPVSPDFGSSPETAYLL
jgi:hypothetical protein